MKRVMMAAGLAAVVHGQADAEQQAPQGKDFDKAPPLVLRTRIPLPGVYGRIDHYGWDGKRANLIVSALGNETVEIVNSWKRVHTITNLEHPQAAVYVRASTGLRCRANRASCASMMRSPTRSSRH